MPDIYDAFDKSPTPASAHIVQGHVKGAKGFDPTKGYFTEEDGTAIDTDAALRLLAQAKTKITGMGVKTKDTRTATSGAVTVKALKSDPTRPTHYAFAVTWGVRTGTDRHGRACTWICFVLGPAVAGRHQWVTAFPCDKGYVDGKA
jgi:hypothetical protein